MIHAGHLAVSGVNVVALLAPPKRQQWLRGSGTMAVVDKRRCNQVFALDSSMKKPRQISSVDILTELCSVATAPFAEAAVVQYVRQFVDARKRRLRLVEDQFGNLLIELAPPRKRVPRWVFAAHMDHPGFVARRMIDPSTLEADFHGYVLADYFDGSRVRFFHDGRETRGVIIGHRAAAGDRGRPNRATVRVASAVPAGAAGHVGSGRWPREGRCFSSRVCDDLAGAAAALAMLEELQARPPAAASVAVLLTRAEEEGFIGAIGAAIEPKLLRPSDRIIAIECSAMQPDCAAGRRGDHPRRGSHQHLQLQPLLLHH